ncbi:MULTISPECIES: alpha/beta fold hydrolase [unclassified Limnothrix]|uniref:alpha/beta hydrolase n=1 Tax=unclassified Limnothrix TaxID=2632864 RepID=UPI001F54BFE2|nr:MULTISPECIES: alpha/beta fold hydrolase [unclassified Limnothrix]
MSTNLPISNYRQVIGSMTQQVQTLEAKLPLKHPDCRSRFWLHDRPVQRVCLLFHGFTAAPYQFVPIGEALYRAGYNVLAPLMPGHGQAGKWNSQTPPPLPIDPKVYQDFGLEWVAKARTFGQQVSIGGLSGGGTLAAWLAQERPQEIYRALLFAPYLSSSSKVVDLFVSKTQGYFSWGKGAESSSFDRPGYPGFAVPALATMLKMGQQVLDRARRQPSAPLFVISSQSDQAVGIWDHRALWEDNRKRQPITWQLVFNRVLDIPHTMMTQEEGNRYASLLITLTQAFIESSLTWSDVEAIARRMMNSETFMDAATKLRLTDRVSVHMPAAMTLFDKRAFAMDDLLGENRD